MPSNGAQIEQILAAQKAYYHDGTTLPTAFRVAQLKRLYREITDREQEIVAALQKDLGKHRFESYMCEIGITLSEISYMIKHCRRFAKPKRVRTPLSQFAANSSICPTPYGNVLIMSPWNYPFLLTMEPLVDAIAAGNTAIVKPSAYSPATAAVVRSIIEACFAPEYVAVITGGRAENTALLQQKFDFVFFTGSQKVGKDVLRHTAEHLTPAVLELGGKSPCIVDETAKIRLTAKRIVFGKYLNCGQTCVAPDFILCHKSIKARLIQAICAEIVAQFGEDPLQNPEYGKIINEKHFHRLLSLMDGGNIVHGGQCRRETLQIAPTVMDNVTFADAVMQEEIFGPILPILTYEHTGQIYDMLTDRPTPLALYLFTENKKQMVALTGRLRYGGGCINDTIIHLAASNLPFGGMGESGMGAYHGRFGFDTFSHQKAIVNKKTWMDLPLRYHPYSKSYKDKIVRRFLR
ncbi:MAG: aldehyde dehydrogenase [Oscillospiraceae bacterium]